MTTPVEILNRAAELVAPGQAIGTFAVDAEGNRVAYSSDKAKCFCAYGALWRAGLELTGQRYHDATLEAEQLMVDAARIAENLPEDQCADVTILNDTRETRYITGLFALAVWISGDAA